MAEQLVQSILEAESQAEQMRRGAAAQGRDALIEAEAQMKDAYGEKIAAFTAQAQDIAAAAQKETDAACRQAGIQAKEQGEALRQRAEQNMAKAIAFIVERMS